MSIETQRNQDTLTIFLPETFNMTTYHEFNQAYQSHLNDAKHFVLDFYQTHHLDSAALGLLLLLRQRVGDGKRIKLIHLSDSVESTLKIAQFQQLFDINA